jgi:hypothetical protein
LYYLLTAQVPFSGSSPIEIMLKHQADPPPLLTEVRSDAPAGLGKVINKMLAKNPDDRYANAREVAEALAPFCPEIVAETTAMAAVEPRPLARKLAAIPRTWLSVAAVSAVTAVAGLIFVIVWLQGGSGGAASSTPGHLPTMTVKTTPEIPPVEKLVRDEGALYKAMKVTDFRLEGGPHHAGDTLYFKVRLVLTGDKSFAALPMERSRTKYGVGMAQCWIERLGANDAIPCLDSRLAKVGRKYAAGGLPLECLARLAPGQEVLTTREVKTDVTRAGDALTERFPPGKYRYTLEYRSADNNNTFHTSEAEFELLP